MLLQNVKINTLENSKKLKQAISRDGALEMAVIQCSFTRHSLITDFLYYIVIYLSIFLNKNFNGNKPPKYNSNIFKC